MDNNDDINVQTSRGEFWLELQHALDQAHCGLSVDRIENMRLSEIVDVLAQNGIRLTYDANKVIGNRPPL